MYVTAHNNLLSGTALWTWSHQVKDARSDLDLLGSTRWNSSDQQEFRKPAICILSRPGSLRFQNEVATNLEVFVIGYSVGGTVPIGPVYAVSLLSHWVTRSLITTVLGLGREDVWTSLLRPSEGVVALPALLDELLLHSGVSF
jgi:hypothetical protein